MLHIVRESPFASRTLEDCLALLGPQDRLLLVQDAVIAATAPEWLARLQSLAIPPSLLAEDLVARGLMPQIGQVIDMAGFVALVVSEGSPLRW